MPVNEITTHFINELYRILAAESDIYHVKSVCIVIFNKGIYRMELCHGQESVHDIIFLKVVLRG